MGLEATFKNAMMDHLIGGSAYTPVQLYMSLHASSGTELTGNGYARKALPSSAAIWNTASNGSIKNRVNIDFATATGSGWGQIASWKLWNHATATASSNLLWSGSIGTVISSVSNGDNLRFEPDMLIFFLT
tara:strand:+ start:905 stop:1297 length:393 start_codon:yes stop_codon:yes gene_type:complete